MPFDDRDRGALFSHDKRGNAKAPDMRGKLTFSQELLEVLNQQMSERKAMTLEISAWRTKSKNGQVFLSMRMQKPYDGQKQDNIREEPKGRSSYSGQGGQRYDNRPRRIPLDSTGPDPDDSLEGIGDQEPWNKGM